MWQKINVSCYMKKSSLYRKILKAFLMGNVKESL